MCECGRLHVNASRVDPTRTTGLRKRFEAELTKRFALLKQQVVREIVKEDGFGIRTNAGRFDFARPAQKVTAFMNWLNSAESLAVLGVRYGTPMERAANSAWSNIYLQEAYKQGVNRAAGQLRKGGAKVTDRWIDSAFRRPIHADRVGLIYTRAYSQLEGITRAMDSQISSVLANGIAQGLNPTQIASQINNRIDKIGLTRARTLARTEVISAHAEATLNSFEEAGVADVEVEAEWATAGDDKVCPICEALEGRVFTRSEARGMLPAHPNCRCAWLPVVKNGTGIELV